MGWYTPLPQSSYKGYVAGVPAQTSAIANGSGQLAGTTALALLASGLTYPADSSAPGSAAITVAAWKPIPYTWQQVWTAGGITLGTRIKFNQDAYVSYGQANYYPFCMATDGTSILALQNNGNATYSLAFSTDGINFTTMMLPIALGSTGYNTRVFYIGNGTWGFTLTPSNTIYTCTGLSANPSWTTTTIAPVGGTAAGSGYIDQVIATGNPTYPYLVSYLSVSVAADSSIGSIAAFGGTQSVTRMWSFNTIQMQVINIQLINGYLFFSALRTSSISGVHFYSFPIASLSASWTPNDIVISTATGTVYAYYFIPSSNVYLIVTSLGCYTTPNAGTVTAPVPPSGTATFTASNTGITGLPRGSAFNAANNTWVVGTYNGATGNNLYYSTNGSSWTAATGTIVSGLEAQYGAAGGYWGVVATSNFLMACGVLGHTLLSTDSQHWTVGYTVEYPENTTNNAGLGWYGATALNTTTGTYTNPASGSAIIIGSGLSAGNRTMTIATYGTSATSGTIPNTTNGGWHYLELDCTPTATNLQFSCQMYVDSVALGSPFTATLTAGSAQLTLNLPVVGALSQYDDLIIILKDSVLPNARMGSISILEYLPSSDVQAHWTKSGSQPSNSAALASVSAYLSATNYLTSNAAGTKDIYNINSSVPTGYGVRYVFAEVTLQAITTNATVSLGCVSGSAETDAAPQTITAGASPITIQAVFNVDPNTNAAWTTAAALDAELALIQVS